MKIKIIISLLGFLMIAGAFGDGCEEEEPKPDYINVYVNASALYFTKNGNTTYCDSVTQNKPIKFEFYKSDALKYTIYRNTDSDCITDITGNKSFKLYREQRIEVWAYSEEVPGGYTQIRGYELIDWDDIYPEYDFGDKAFKNVQLTVFWLFN